MGDVLSITSKDLADSTTVSVTSPSTIDLSSITTGDTITLSSLFDVTATPGYSISQMSGLGQTLSPNTIYTTSTGVSPWVTDSTISAPKIKLDGEGADIEVNGVSLMDLLTRMEQRLNLLSTNAELEAEWNQLRDLGDQYRALEKKLQEQGDMWTRLKAMPPPDIT